jgi:hypothetical protein
MDMQIIRVAIARAGVVRADDTSFTAEALRAQADGETRFWDEESQTLYYQGTLPVRRLARNGDGR